MRELRLDRRPLTALGASFERRPHGRRFVVIVPRRRFGVASALLLRAALCLSILASAALGSVRIPWADVASVSGGGVSRPAWNEMDWPLLP
ncbi:MAG: hypothetical protein AAF690_30740, partial [Acidobacteriota bacterium]